MAPKPPVKPPPKSVVVTGPQKPRQTALPQIGSLGRTVKPSSSDLGAMRSAFNSPVTPGVDQTRPVPQKPGPPARAARRPGGYLQGTAPSLSAPKQTPAGPKRPGRPSAVKATIHPDGRVTVEHTAPSAPAAAAAPAPAAPAGNPHGTATSGGTTYYTSRGDVPLNGGTLGFEQGRGYYAKPGAARTPAASSTPVSSGSSGAGLSDEAYARQQVQAILAPLIQQVQDSLNGRARLGQQAITDYSGGLAKLFGGYGPQAQSAYSQAAQGIGASNAALADRLQGQGGATADQLAGKLAAINAAPDTTSRVVGAAQQQGTGAANAGYAIGSADVAKLLSRSANAGDYGAKLPGVAGLSGLRDTRQLQASTQQQLADQLGKIEAQAPGLIQTILGQRQDARYKQQALDQQAQIFNISQGNKAADRKIKQYNAQTSRQRALDAAANADANRSLRERTVGISEKRLKLEIAKEVNKEKTQGKYLGLTPQKYTEYTSLALGAARTYHSNWSDAKGNQQSPLSWQQYLNHGLSSKVPVKILIEQGRRVYSQREIKLGLIPKGR